ncbi:hypothetical protein ACMU_14815 [Actibacterium mucosum KCTC 23349]|uniref:Uncharacterized protein n=1 Tax=Actibacterium mucosum KCTC 23349 TaxID=1454373 RepID=A0A037ZEY0_9RHOB|nr:hypothetical protein [Actibacterium mucosum]KAJ55025.1 hypothetical protein ACMU_14815 [Actibacterium mucosum KCTC 23349]
MKEFFAVTLCLGVLIAGSVRAQTMQSCGPRAAVLEQLQTKYGETRRAIGLGANSVMEVHANDQTGSWTITVTNADGVTCLVSSGQAFETMAAALPGQGA